MEKILNQAEIDALFRASQSATKAVPAKAKEFTACDFRRVGQISERQMRAVSSLHESFARNLTTALGAYLRAVLEVNLVSVEQLTYQEFLQRIPDTAYLVSVEVKDPQASAVLHIDLQLAFPFVDLLLGGSGKAESSVRELTAIEEEILETVTTIVVRELGASWQPLGLDLSIGLRQQPAQAQQLMSPTERTLSLSFELRLPEVRGTLSLVVPAVVSTRVLQRIDQQWAQQVRAASPELVERLRGRMLKCAFPIELSLLNLVIKARELVALRPGQVLNLGCMIKNPAVLAISGCPRFQAEAARRGRKRAAHVLERKIGKAENGEGTWQTAR